MRKFLVNAGFGALAVLGAFAVPGQASTVLEFSSISSGCTVGGSGSAGCGSATGAGGSISAFSIYSFTGFTEQVNGGTIENWAVTHSTWSYSAGTYTLDGDISCTSGICAGKNTGSTPIALLTIAGAAPTYTTGLNTAAITIGAATSLTETATFLNDLGLTTPAGTPTVTGGATANGSTSPFTLTASATLGITTSQIYTTPEPVSFLLFGTGLLAVTLFARRKSRQPVSAPAK
jgi:hypothetical protein